MNEFEGLTKEEIEELVNEAAEQLIADGLDSSIEAARASIWEGDSGVYEAHSAARSLAPIEKAIAPPGRPQTLREWGYEAIRKRAKLASLSRGNWGKTIEQLVVEVMESPDGALVYTALSASHLATQPAAEVLTQVSKSAAGWNQLNEAISIASRWKNG